MANNKKVIIPIVFILALVTVAWFFRASPRVASIPKGGSAQITIGDAAYSIEIAETMASQIQGLSSRDSLAQGHGMLFIFQDSAPRSFWMYQMKFPLDIIWINENKVIGFAQDVPPPVGGPANFMPPTVNSPGPADMVFEVPAGTVANDGIVEGAEVQVLR